MPDVVRAAALDLGSNTLRLLVADVYPGGWRAVARSLATPRLGGGLAGPGGRPRLDPAAKERVRQAAEEFTALARRLGARRVVLAATQACRRAADGEAFVAELGQGLGLERATVLSGEQEAALSRLGVLSRLQGPRDGALLADVGGGSTELTPLDDEAAPALSLQLGAVSLTEAHLASDPPLPAELTALDQAVARGLQKVVPGARRLVATAGSAATLASLVQGLTDYQPEEVNNLRVSAGELAGQARRLAAMPLARRREVPGLEPARADIILAGLAILRGLLERLGLDELTTMDAGLLEGIVLDDLAGWQYVE